MMHFIFQATDDSLLMRQMKLSVTKVLIMSGGRIVHSHPYQHPGYFRETLLRQLSPLILRLVVY